MNRYRCTTAIVFALLLLGAWAWTGKASADDGPATHEELAAAAKQNELRDKQLTGLAACVIAVFTVAGVTWLLNAHNKARKREALLQRQQARQEADLQKQALQECDLPTLPVQSEPSASYW
jgi:hypothetical protein